MDPNIPYNYQSVMHYGKDSFGGRILGVGFLPTYNTMKPKQKGAEIGQRRALSGTDVMKILHIYKGVDRCKGETF